MNEANPKDVAKALLVACAVGLPAALAALALLAGSHALTSLLWTDLPQSAGFSGSSWWYVLSIPTIGGLLAGLAARHLPGNGGHDPINGFSPSPVQPNAILGVVLAALASLGFGAVLGPEAPLVALGSALGLWFAHLFKLTGTLAPLAGAAGLFAAVGALFGNPLLAAFLILEVLGMTAATAAAPMAAVIIPGMLASALGYLAFVGVDNWTGITADGLTPIQLPDYPTVKPIDLLWAIVIGLVMAVLVAAVRHVGQRVHTLTTAHPALLAPAAGLTIGVLAVLFHAITGHAPHLVLFSGETDTQTVVSQSGTWGLSALLVLLLLKSLAYAASLGSLFRGGPVFPSLFLGVVAGTTFTHVAGHNLTSTPAVVAGMAAACAAMLRLPLSSVMLAVLLTTSAGLEATSIALIASVAGFLASIIIDNKRAPQPQPATTAAPSPTTTN